MGKTRVAGVALVWLAVMAGFFMLGERSALAPPLPACNNVTCREVSAWYAPNQGEAYALLINITNVSTALLNIDSPNPTQGTKLVFEANADQYSATFDSVCTINPALFVQEKTFKVALQYRFPATQNKCGS
jgi:hypothetical protein